MYVYEYGGLQWLHRTFYRRIESRILLICLTRHPMLGVKFNTHRSSDKRSETTQHFIVGIKYISISQSLHVCKSSIGFGFWVHTYAAIYNKNRIKYKIRGDKLWPFLCIICILIHYANNGHSHTRTLTLYSVQEYVE